MVTIVLFKLARQRYLYVIIIYSSIYEYIRYHCRVAFEYLIHCVYMFVNRTCTFCFLRVYNFVKKNIFERKMRVQIVLLVLVNVKSLVGLVFAFVLYIIYALACS